MLLNQSFFLNSDIKMNSITSYLHAGGMWSGETDEAGQRVGSIRASGRGILILCGEESYCLCFVTAYLCWGFMLEQKAFSKMVTINQIYILPIQQIQWREREISSLNICILTPERILYGSV